MAAELNQKLNSLGGFMLGCPVCGGHTYAQKITKRRRAREGRIWRREALTN